MNGRKILLDTETTGLSNKTNRIIDIGLVEIVDYVETGNIYQSYLNPNMPISPMSQKICGITDIMVKDAPDFQDIVQDILDFIGDSPIVAHNARFDMGFMNMELARIGLPPIKNEVIDTLKIARSLYKNNNSLDALCRRFGVNLSNREKHGHGALLDCHLLGQVYYFLVHASTQNIIEMMEEEIVEKIDYKFPNRPVSINKVDLEKHENFCKEHDLIAS